MLREGGKARSRPSQLPIGSRDFYVFDCHGAPTSLGVTLPSSKTLLCQTPGTLLVQFFERRRTEPISASPYAASTAMEIIVTTDFSSPIYLLFILVLLK